MVFLMNFVNIHQTRNMGYEDEPDYEGLKNLFRNVMNKNNLVDDKHFDWFNLKDKNGNNTYNVNRNLSNQPVFNSTMQANASNTFGNKDNLHTVTEEKFPNANNMGAILETNALNNKEEKVKYIDTNNNFNTKGDKYNPEKSGGKMNTNSNVKEDKNKKVIKDDMKNVVHTENNDNSKVNKTDLNQSGTSNRKKDKDKNKNCCIL